MDNKLLSVQNLNIEFKTRRGLVKTSNDISFDIKKNETLCIVGESGCGKSVIAVSITGLLPENASVKGEIIYSEKNLLLLTKKQLCEIRGKEIAMIFEQPMSCLNPVICIGKQISEAYKKNYKCSSYTAKLECLKKLEEVGIPKGYYKLYPHELSGGMQQRVMIAMALICKPKLLIADEPTTSLDVTVQYQILELLKELKERYKMSLIIITHDLGVVAEMADKVATMYAGNIMELSNVKDFFKNPLHPYSKALLNVFSGKNFQPILGNVPNLMESFDGCPFHSRCSESKDVCKIKIPKKIIIKDRMGMCHFVKSNES